MAPDNRIAICPGSYDPVTYGHLDVISRAAAMFDKVIVGGGEPARAQGRHAVQRRGARRVRGARHAGLDNVTVEPFSILVVDFARERGAKAIVKGLRAISDFEYELEMNQLNRRQAPDIESVYLMASPKYSFLRSSGVKELATFGGNIEDMVPDEVATALKERLGR